MYSARKVSSCWERENPFLLQLMLHILLWWHGFLRSSGKGHPGTLGERERKEAWMLRSAMCSGHHPEGGASLGAERWAWPGVVTLHREALRTSYSNTETLAPISFVSHSFPKSSSLWSFCWLVWCFPCSQEKRWVSLIHPKEKRYCCVSFLFHMERHRRMKTGQMGVTYLERERGQMKKYGGGRATLIKHHKFLSLWHIKAESFNIFWYFLLQEDFRRAGADLPPAWGGTGICSCPVMPFIPWGICSNVIGSGNQ